MRIEEVKGQICNKGSILQGLRPFQKPPTLLAQDEVNKKGAGYILHITPSHVEFIQA